MEYYGFIFFFTEVDLHVTDMGRKLQFFHCTHIQGVLYDVFYLAMKQYCILLCAYIHKCKYFEEI